MRASSLDASSVASDAGTGAVLLLSGGIDSAALAALVRPAWALVVDYGQRPAAAEIRAARAIAAHLGIPIAQLTVDLTSVGSGLLLRESTPDPLVDEDGGGTASASVPSPSPEWWPMRNQLLCTLASAWALGRTSQDGTPLQQVITATVQTDGARHVDGTPAFYEALDSVTRMQEGNIAVRAPAIHLSAVELVTASGADGSLLGWTHSCHRSELPCAACPGCWKREQVLVDLKMLSH